MRARDAYSDLAAYMAEKCADAGQAIPVEWIALMAEAEQRRSRSAQDGRSPRARGRHGCRPSRRSRSHTARHTGPNAVALWTGYRLGVLDPSYRKTSRGCWIVTLMMLDIAKGGYIAGRAGMTTTEVLNQLERERHEAVARMSGIGQKATLT